MANRWGNSGSGERLLFSSAPKSLMMVLQPWNQRRLLLGRKAMTNLDSILKSRDITVPTKFCIVKAMVLPVVMYGCEHQRIDTFELWCWKRFLRVPWTANRSNQLVLKEISPEYSFGRTDTEAKAPILWPPDVKSWLIRKNPDAGKDWRKEKGMTADKMVGWHHRLNAHEFEQALGDGEGQGSLVCCSPWGHKESDVTEWMNNGSFFWLSYIRIKSCEVFKFNLLGIWTLISVLLKVL